MTQLCEECGEQLPTTWSGSSCELCWFGGPLATAPSLGESPCPLSLVPCATAAVSQAPVEPEVDHLVRLHREGRFEPKAVELPDLPADATDSMRVVAADFALVRGLRLAAGDDRAVPYAVRWVAARVGLPYRTVARSLKRLEEAGVLVRADAMPGRGSRGTQLWAPAPVRGADVLPFLNRRAVAS